jgi:RHS repeat-associated protein
MKRVQPHSLRRWFAGVILLLAAFAPHLFASGHFPAAGDTLHASFPNSHLFTGEEFDADLGLYHLRARYHNPDTGRFWTQDGFEGFGGDPASLHKYAYCGNNPVNARDPGGEMSIGEVSHSMVIGGMSSVMLGGITRALGAASGGAGLMETLESATSETADEFLSGALGGAAGYGVGKAAFWAAGRAAPWLLQRTPAAVQMAFTRAATSASRAWSQAEAAWAKLEAEMVQGTQAGVERLFSEVLLQYEMAAFYARTADGLAAFGNLPRFLLPRLPTAKTAAGAGDEMVTVFRGVGGNHPGFQNAIQGKAVPFGGHADAALHNAFDTRSIFTSWTTDYSTAVRFGLADGPGGAVLRQTVPRSSLIMSPDKYLEFEVLRSGPISGATTIILSP